MIELQPSESTIDTWPIIYIPPKGGTYKGKLTITNKRLLYNARSDMPATGLFTEALFEKDEGRAFLEIEKKDIVHVEVEKNFLAKKAIVILNDGSRHTFSYGVLNIDKVVEAIKSW
jgi:hypothetical protein